MTPSLSIWKWQPVLCFRKFDKQKNVELVTLFTAGPVLWFSKPNKRAYIWPKICNKNHKFPCLPWASRINHIKQYPLKKYVMSMKFIPMSKSISSSSMTRLSLFSVSLGKLAVEKIVWSSSILSLASSISTWGTCFALLPVMSLITELNIPWHAK